MRVLQSLLTLNTPALRKTSFLSYSTRQESKITFNIKTCLQTCTNQFCLITIIRSSTWLTLYFCWALDQLPLEIYTNFLENTSSKCTWTKITFISVTHSTNQAVGNISYYRYNFMYVNDISCRSQDPDAFHKQP